MPGRQRGCGGDRAGRLAALRPARRQPRAARQRRAPDDVVTFEDAAPVQKARGEMIAGIRGMLGTALNARQCTSGEAGRLLSARWRDCGRPRRRSSPAGTLAADGFWVKGAATGPGPLA